MSSDRRVGFTIVRMLDATPQQVWRMWTEASELTHWLHPDGAVTPVDTIDFDVRVGGRLRYTMIEQATGESYPVSGLFREVDPLRRLVFTWGTGDGPDDDDDVTVITLNLAARDGGTELTLDVRGVPEVAGDGDVHDGWDQALALLAEHAARRPLRTLHVGLRVADRDASVAFYRNLGYEVVGTVAETPIGHLTMLKLPGDEFVTLELVHSADDGPGLSHLVVATDAMDDTVARLSAKGIDATDDSPPDSGGIRTARVTDPDGNWIELVQWPAGHPAGMTAADFRNDEDTPH